MTSTVEVGSFCLDLDRRELRKDGIRVSLGGRALEILCALAAADGETVSKEELLACVWRGAIVCENNLHVHISEIRKLLGESGRKSLVTVPGYGYRLLSVSPPDEQCAAGSDKPTMAVLTFRELSDETAHANFVDGLTDDVITQLARTRSLLAVACTIGRSGETDPKQIGRRFGVRYVLEGSVRLCAKRIRVNVRLVEAETRTHLWASTYDRELDDPDCMQVELANTIAAAVEVAVSDLEQKCSLRKPTRNLSAWEAYERGLWHFAVCGIEQNEMARDFLQRAIILDPEFSKAYQWLVYVYVQDGMHYRTTSIDEARDIAEELAMKAIELDRNDAGAYAALGFVAQMSNDLPNGLANAKRALSLNPNDGDALRLKGACELGLGFGAEGTETLRGSVRLRSSDPLNWRASHHLCWYSYLVGDYARAVKAGRSALFANRNQCLTHSWLAAALAQLGEIEKAQKVMTRSANIIAGQSFNEHVRRRLPWIPEEGHERMLDGLRKAGWQG
jgi:adenylate cyclase